MPCSRSRIRAAPARMTDSMVMLSMIFITPPNQIPLSVRVELHADDERDDRRGVGAPALDEAADLAGHDVLDVSRRR